ncbi:unnamed protein product, partial [Rotaria sp. Silwood1]
MSSIVNYVVFILVLLCTSGLLQEAIALRLDEQPHRHGQMRGREYKLKHMGWRYHC